MKDHKKIKKFGFPKEVRLRKTKEFELCYKEGKRVSSKHFIFYIRKRSKDGIGLRAGISVSKKLGKAVLRNRIKRLIKEFIRLHRHEIKEDLDVIVIPKRDLNVKGLKYKDVESELYPVFTKLKKEYV